MARRVVAHGLGSIRRLARVTEIRVLVLDDLELS
jgi:hypothetical protein